MISLMRSGMNLVNIFTTAGSVLILQHLWISGNSNFAATAEEYTVAESAFSLPMQWRSPFCHDAYYAVLFVLFHGNGGLARPIYPWWELKSTNLKWNSTHFSAIIQLKNLKKIMMHLGFKIHLLPQNASYLMFMLINSILQHIRILLESSLNSI